MYNEVSDWARRVYSAIERYYLILVMAGYWARSAAFRTTKQLPAPRKDG